MPDGGGGGQQTQWSNSSSTSTTGPSPVIAPRLQTIGDDFWKWYDGNSQAPAYFGPTSPGQQSARDATWYWGNKEINAADDAFRPAVGSLTDTLSGRYLDPNTNTAFQDFLSASFRPQAEQFRDIIAPSIDAKFAGSGRTGSGAHFDTTMRGVQDLERAQADAAAKAGLGLYQGERNLMSSAASALPGVLGAKTGIVGNWLDTIRGVGAADTAEDRARYSYETTAQPDWLAKMAQIVQSIYPGGQTTGSGSSYGGASGGGGGGWMGSALGGAGLALQALPLLGFSDERLKDVEGRVGHTDDGLPLYLYRYKGDDQPRIGPMAQEVAQVKPDAVAEHPSGFLMVDYRKAMPEGGLL